jgi:branched-subunit amino acid aminotransferase/4-amino-4-deoxychorismate lyase
MTSNSALFAFINHQIMPLKEAFLHVSDLSIQRGFGVFDFFRLHQGQPLFLPEYLDRFYLSAGMLGLEVPLQREALTETITTLIRKNNLPVSGIKMILTGGYSADGYAPAAPNLIITQQPVALPDPAKIEKGIKIITHGYVRELPLCKTINYTMGLRLIPALREAGADDVLYCHEGLVTEFPRCNFFIVTTDNTVMTPAADVLLGVTRKKVLELARQQYRVVEGPVTLADIGQAREAFLTSTTKRILPVVGVNGTPVGDGRPGEVTLALLQSLRSMEEKDVALS